MKLHELLPTEGSTHRRKVVGRGPGSGHGKTSCRGEKGQLSRSGGHVPAWFEGGQNPLYKRLPAKGFNNKRFTIRYAVINVCELNRFENDTVVTPELLKEVKLLNKELCGVKILGNGELTKKLTVKANIFTNSAIKKIEQSGGKA
ncbi:MAG: 50S ribosomal protein L15, partial [Erysipelotrichaceae bacterium]